MELAEQGGFEAVRLRDVASHAGVALGTLYRRFRSKEDLLLAALEQEVDDVRRRFEKRPPEGATPLERVTVFFQITTRALCRRPNLARALVRSVATGEPELTQKVATFHTLMEELITAALRGESPMANLRLRQSDDERRARLRAPAGVVRVADRMEQPASTARPRIVDQTAQRRRASSSVRTGTIVESLTSRERSSASGARISTTRRNGAARGHTLADPLRAERTPNPALSSFCFAHR